jgi:protein TonB
MLPIMLAGAMLVAQPADGMAAPQESAEWIEATANRAKIKTRPSLTEGEFPVLPAAEKAQGHHGEVTISGIITIQGALTEARVSQSSGVPELDDIALAAARAFRFAPAQDAQGNAIPIIAAIPFKLAAYAEGDGLAGEYRCEQFLLDLAWWQSVNPDTPVKQHELYNMMLGFQTIALMNGGNSANAGKGVAFFDKRWGRAFERCRDKPQALLLQVLFR